MKKCLLLLLPFFLVITACDNRFLTGKQVFSFTNDSSKDVIISVASENLSVAKNHTETIEAFADANISIDSYYRCNLLNVEIGTYSIVDASGKEITVYNSSTQAIILYDQKRNIGSYNELLQAVTDKLPLDEVNLGVEIPAETTVTFELYSKNPEYYAVFKDSQLPADLALLSFK